MSEELKSTPEEPVTEAAKETAAATAVPEEAAAPEPAESMDDYKKELEASFKKVHEGDIMTGTVIGVSETEITLDLKYYTEGIIRLEDFTNDPNFNLKEDVQIGDEISATVIRTDDGQGHILLSAKEANDVLAWDKLKAYLENQTNLKVKVGGIVKSGVVAYLEGIRGFIPASRLSLSYIEDLESYLLKDIEVQVIDVDQANNRLVLSARELLREKERKEKEARIASVKVGSVVTGTVESLQNYGAFIRLEDGLSGLVHVSQISQKRVKHPKDILNTGDEVTVKIIGVKDGKISLSMKALEEVAEEPEEKVEIPKAENIGTSLGDLFKGITL